MGLDQNFLIREIKVLNSSIHIFYRMSDFPWPYSEKLEVDET